MIEFKQVQKTYNKKTTVIENATFRIEQGEFVFLVGASGAGKSTLLKMLYKAEKPTSGNITLYQRNIKNIRRTTLRRMIGIVFQDFESTLLKNKTAYENVAYVLESQGQSPSTIKTKTLYALEKMGVLDKMKHFPHELSGGEKQRVAIARAIANKPEMLICDEPTGNLDPENAEVVMDYLNQLNQEGTTIVMTTHNTTILEKEKKRTLLVEKGEVREKKQGEIPPSTSPFSLTNLIMARDSQQKVE